MTTDDPSVALFARAVQSLLLPGVQPTARQLEVAYLMVGEGRDRREIGALLSISPFTAAEHWENFMRKLTRGSNTAHRELLIAYLRLQPCVGEE